MSASPSYACAADYVPVAEYSFDEGTGETVEDLTGDRHTATIHGAEWTTHGRYGDAMEFDASAHDYLSIPADPGLDGDEELTVEAWVRPTATPYYGEIVMKERKGAGPAYSWTLDQHEMEAGGYFMQTEEGMVAGGQRSLPNDTWTHVAMTDDGARNRLYANGRLVDTEPAIPFDGHGDIRIGDDGIWEQWFDGRYFTEIRQQPHSTAASCGITDPRSGRSAGVGPQVWATDGIVTVRPRFMWGHRCIAGAGVESQAVSRT